VKIACLFLPTLSAILIVVVVMGSRFGRQLPLDNPIRLALWHYSGVRDELGAKTKSKDSTQPQHAGIRLRFT